MRNESKADGTILFSDWIERIAVHVAIHGVPFFCITHHSVSFRFALFRSVSFRFVPLCSVSFRLVPLCSVMFRCATTLLRFGVLLRRQGSVFLALGRCHAGGYHRLGIQAHDVSPSDGRGSQLHPPGELAEVSISAFAIPSCESKMRRLRRGWLFPRDFLSPRRLHGEGAGDGLPVVAVGSRSVSQSVSPSVRQLFTSR